MAENVILRRRVDEAGFTQAEFAEAVTSKLRSAGHPGSVSDRTVRNWLTGKTRWPHPRQRVALKALFGCPTQALGFVQPTSPLQSTPPEAPVLRRTFLTSGTATAAAVAVPALGNRRSVGTSDVLRLRSRLDTLNALDDQRGGHAALESAALGGAQESIALQQASASGRVRLRLFSVAADYSATAAWSCIDSRELDRATSHVDRALTLAGLAQDSTTQLRLWNFMSMLAYQRRRYSESVAAGHAALATGATRKDPLAASLAHARTAIAHAASGDRNAALRSLGHATDALGRADDRSRPSWMSFYGEAELHALSAVTYQELGESERAETASHQALSVLPHQFRRNRTSVTARLALAQLGQGDIDQACDTATSVYHLMGDDPIPERLRSLLGDFHRGLITLAPASTAAREWTDRVRTPGSKQ